MKLVHELQNVASSTEFNTVDVLRKAMLVAGKTKRPDILQWLNNELDGYDCKPEQLPWYRKLLGGVFYRRLGLVSLGYGQLGTMEGHIHWDVVPTVTVHVFQSIPSLTNMLSIHTENDAIKISLPSDLEKAVREWCKLCNERFTDFEWVQKVHPSEFTAVIETVKTSVLRWAIDLEAEGVLGEDMTITPEEVEKAQKVELHLHQHIGKISGDLNNNENRSEN